MGRLNTITHLENMIYHKDYSKYSHSEMVKMMKQETDTFIHSTKPKERPPVECFRFRELERIYGLHSRNKKIEF